MKGLATLIKLHKRNLDELRRKMVSLENQKVQLRLLSAKLNEELKEEIRLASQRPEMGNFFGDFAKRIKTRQEDIAAEIKALDKQMEKLQDEIAAEFAEVKKFEIAQENERLRARAKEARKETIVLDEIASQQHRRKEEEA